MKKINEMIQMDRHEENVANAVTSDDEDPLEEDEAKLRSIHFLKQEKGTDSGDEEGKVNVSRYDEMGSFLTRSERSMNLPDTPPSEEELATRKVHIREEAVNVYDVDPMSEEEAQAYYMTDADFRRVDVDVELTQMRYEKAKKVRVDGRQGNEYSYLLT